MIKKKIFTLILSIFFFFPSLQSYYSKISFNIFSSPHPCKRAAPWLIVTNLGSRIGLVSRERHRDRAKMDKYRGDGAKPGISCEFSLWNIFLTRIFLTLPLWTPHLRPVFYPAMTVSPYKSPKGRNMSVVFKF